MDKINFKKIAGYAILVLIFLGIFTAMAIVSSFLVALCVFAAASILTGIIVLAVNWIVS